MTRPFLRPPPWLVLVVDLDQEGVDWEAVVRAAVRGGVDGVQVRTRRLPGGILLEMASRIRSLLPPDVILLINDRVDVAREVRAHGVHLPERGLPPHVARKLYPSGVVGRSLHGPPPPGISPPDYWMFGHVYPTSSHPRTPPRGLQALREVILRTSQPVLAIGGITPERVAPVLQEGAWGVAVISAIARASLPEEATRTLRNALDQAWRTEHAHHRQ